METTDNIIKNTTIVINEKKVNLMVYFFCYIIIYSYIIRSSDLFTDALYTHWIYKLLSNKNKVYRDESLIVIDERCDN